MKLIRNIALGFCLLFSVAATAQTKKPTATKAVTKVHVPTFEERNEEFKKRNPSVKSFTWENGGVLILEKQDGTKEKYKMDHYNDEQKAKQLYGKMPPMPRFSPNSN